MTEKELRKLSRVELLELLLEQIRENEAVKQEKARLEENPGNTYLPDGALAELSRAAHQLNNALCFADRITRQLQEASATEEIDGADEKESSQVTSEILQGREPTKRLISDRVLYWRLMECYSNSPELMSGLPVDIQRSIIHRLKDVKNAK